MSRILSLRNVIVVTLAITLLPVSGYASKSASRRELAKQTLRLKLQKERGTAPPQAAAVETATSSVNIASTETAVVPATIIATIKPATTESKPAIKRTSASGDDELLKLITAEALFCVRINDLDAALMSMDQYLLGVSPMQVTMLAKMQLGKMLGEPMLTGVNTKGNFAVFGAAHPSGGEHNGVAEVSIGLILPTTDTTFTDKKPETKLANKNFAMIIFNGSPETKKALVEKATGKNLMAIMDTEEYARATTAPLWAYGSVVQAVDEYEEVIAEGFEKARLEMKKSQEDCPPGTTAMAIDPTQFLDMYFDFAEMFLTESEFASVTLTPSADRLDLEYTFAAQEDTELSTWLTSSGQTGDYKLAGVLSGTDAVNIVGKYNAEDMKAINEFFMDMFMNSGVFKGDETLGFNEKWEDLMERSMAITGDEMAVSFSLASGKPPFSFVEVVAVTDGPAYRKMMAETWAMVNDMYKGMGLPATFTYKEGIDNYAGYAIDSAKLIFDFPEDDPAKAAIDTMYGDGLEYKMVVTDKAIVMALGPDATAQLKAMIDKLKAGPSAPKGDLKVAFDTIPNAKNAAMVGSYNHMRIFETLPTMLKSLPIPPAQAMMMEGMFSDLDISSISCVAFASDSRNGKLTTHVALPKEHLAEIMGVVMQIQAKAMQNMMKQVPGAAPGTATPVPMPAPAPTPAPTPAPK